MDEIKEVTWVESDFDDVEPPPERIRHNNPDILAKNTFERASWLMKYRELPRDYLAAKLKVGEPYLCKLVRKAGGSLSGATVIPKPNPRYDDHPIEGFDRYQKMMRSWGQHVEKNKANMR